LGPYSFIAELSQTLKEYYYQSFSNSSKKMKRMVLFQFHFSRTELPQCQRRTLQEKKNPGQYPGDYSCKPPQQNNSIPINQQIKSTIHHDQVEFMP
jgi:hypothetical protein